MATLTPTGILGAPLELFMQLVAASTTLQTITGLNSSELYQALVVFGADAEAARPLVIVDLAQSRGDGQDMSRMVLHDFILDLEFDTPKAYEDSTRDALIWINNQASAILAEMAAAQDQLRLRSFNRLWLARSDMSERHKGDDYVQITLMIRGGF